MATHSAKDTAKRTYSAPDDQQQSDPEDLFAVDLGLHLVGKGSLHKHVQRAHAEGEHGSADVHREEGGFLRAARRNRK